MFLQRREFDCAAGQHNYYGQRLCCMHYNYFNSNHIIHTGIWCAGIKRQLKKKTKKSSDIFEKNL